MEQPTAIDPVAILFELEELCRASATGQPRSSERGAEWSGIAFRIGDAFLVAQLGEVVEILEYPELTRVPLTRSWVCGIANVRGNLLPVIDLGGYLNGDRTRLTPRSRVLVMDRYGLYTGLVVDEVFGLRHFTDVEYTGSDPQADENLRPYLQNGFLQDGRIWSIFNLQALAQAPAFLQVAV